MLARELIAALSAHPPDAEVLLPGYEDGYDRIDAVVERDVQELDHHGQQPYLGAFSATADARRQAARTVGDPWLMGVQPPQLVGDSTRAVVLVPARRA